MKNFTFLLLFFIVSCNSNSEKHTNDAGTESDNNYTKSEERSDEPNCNSLPSSFPTYDAAVIAVESADFEFTDKVNTSKSSWIRAARFYSCNNADGYFIIETDKGNYLHQGVPISVWESFKAADSFGSFYSANIKHQYRLALN